MPIREARFIGVVISATVPAPMEVTIDAPIAYDD